MTPEVLFSGRPPFFEFAFFLFSDSDFCLAPVMGNPPSADLPHPLRIIALSTHLFTATPFHPGCVLP